MADLEPTHAVKEPFEPNESRTMARVVNTKAVYESGFYRSELVQAFEEKGTVAGVLGIEKYKAVMKAALLEIAAHDAFPQGVSLADFDLNIEE